MSKRYNTKDFVDACRRTWGQRYDYSKTSYVSSTQKIEIICPIHGSFFMRATLHLNSGQGCPKCGRVRFKPEIINDTNGLEEFSASIKNALSDNLKEKVQIWWFKDKSTGIICINVNKTEHSSWNLFVIESEIHAVIDYLTVGKLDEKIWTSTTPTLLNKWSIQAFNRFLSYTSQLEDFRPDE